MRYLVFCYRVAAFTGVWAFPVLMALLKYTTPALTEAKGILICSLLTAWIFVNNLWDMTCEGKEFSEFQLGDGVMPETGLKRESAQKKKALHPRVPKELLSKKPSNIILGKYKGHYVCVPKDQILHTAVIGGSGAGKTSTVLLSSLLANHATGKNGFLTFAIDIKGELHAKSTFLHDEATLVVNPTDCRSIGWDAYYRLHNNPSNDLIIEAIEEIAQALIVTHTPKDRFFVENARVMFTGLMVYFFKQKTGFIDAVNEILAANVKELILEIVEASEVNDLWFRYLAKFAGKEAESVEDCMIEMTTSLSVFSKTDVMFCFRDNLQKASPYSFKVEKSIFLAIPEDKLESYAAILRLCTAQTLQELQRRSEDEEKAILVLIDEFARIGRLEIIFNALATLRSKKVMIMLAFQSLAQCEVIYSKEEARVLMDNTRCKVICEVSDPETARKVTDWTGKYREKRETLSTGRSRSKSYSYEDRNVIEPSDLITLVKNEEVIIVLSGTGYLRPKKCYYFKDKTLKALADQVRRHNDIQ